MAVKPTMVHLHAEVIEMLDAKARRRGVSRSQLIREAVDALLSADRRNGLAERYRQAYRVAPADTADEWGDLGAWHAELERIRAAERPREAAAWE